MEQKFKIDKIIRMYFADENGNPKSNIVEVNKTADELDKEYRDMFTSENKNVTVYPKEEIKLLHKVRIIRLPKNIQSIQTTMI